MPNSEQKTKETFPKTSKFQPSTHLCIQREQTYWTTFGKFGGVKFILVCSKNLANETWKLNSTVYFDILARNSLPYMYLGEILQKYNALAQKSTETQTWCSENFVDILENMLLNSPGLKVIKKLWSTL